MSGLFLSGGKGVVAVAWANGAGRCSTPLWRELKRQARQALPYRCAECGRDSGGGLQLDHIIPVAEGGLDELSNLQWLCWPCHREKSNQERARGNARANARRRERLRRPDRYRGKHPGLV